jgi:carbon storage regulator CsrA
MFILVRRVGELMRIGGDIEVRIIRCSDSRVQLAIKAPTALKIWRVDEPKDVAAFPRERTQLRVRNRPRRTQSETVE